MYVPPKVFVSYCHQGIDRNSLEALIHFLKKTFQKKLNIEFDNHKRPGTNLNDFMDQINNVDVVLLILTPSYKVRVLGREGGVFEEYKVIMDRLERVRDDLNKEGANIQEKYFNVIPILFSGDHESSVIEEISHLKYSDFSGFRASPTKSGTPKISQQMAKKYSTKAKEILSSISATASQNSPLFHQDYAKNFKDLFIDLKADWARTVPATLFVETSAFKSITAQIGYIVTGRKGSGKSTITRFVAERATAQDKHHIQIIGDKINLERLFDFHTGLTSEHDTQKAFGISQAYTSQIFQYVWIIFLCMFSMYSCVRKMNEKSSINKEDELLLMVKNFIDEVLANVHKKDLDKQEILNEVMFSYSLESLITTLNESIARSRGSKGLARSDVASLMTESHILDKIFGEKVLESFEQFLAVSGASFLVTLDGFDSAFDQFRRVTIHRFHHTSHYSNFRMLLERTWLGALLRLTLQIKEDKIHSRAPLGEMEFCITVPKDRFLEFLANDRDSYQFNSRFVDLRWSGVELAILLRKRLEILSGYLTNKDSSAKKRLSEVLKASFPTIPSVIEIYVNGKVFKKELFLYLLMVSFWRPRDLLLYFSKILTVNKAMTKHETKLNSDSVRTIVRDTSWAIINSEFINEFVSVNPNLRKILRVFESSKIKQSYIEIEQKLRDIAFLFCNDERPIITDIRPKIEWLYSIGFLGLSMENSTMLENSFHNKHAFIFNEGPRPIRKARTLNLKQFQFVIHPIFIEFLNLRVVEEELILDFSWDYLQTIDKLFQSGDFGEVY